MFSESDSPSPQSEPLTLDSIFQEPTMAVVSPEKTEPESKPLSPSASNPEIVNVVEKISQILAPYFIVLVGLFLYDDSSLVGIPLIVVGLFSLLKLTWQDIQTLLEKVKAFFQSPSN